jgi:transposase
MYLEGLRLAASNRVTWHFPQRLRKEAEWFQPVVIPFDLQRFEGESTMVWTKITRRHYRRDGMRYESDATDAEWFVIEPLLPLASALGRPRATDMRTVMNAILYIASTGCQWRQLPKDFPPYSTVRGYFYAWSRGGLFASLNYTLVMASREAAGREASPTAGVIDSQSVKTTESGGPRGYDAGKRIKDRKRHIVTDTEGNLVGLVVHEASIQDRDGAPCVLASIRSRYPAPYLRRWRLCRRETTQGFEAHRRMGRSKSSNVPTQRRASKFCHADGSLKEPSNGSAVVADWQRISSDNHQRGCLGSRRPHPHPHVTTRKSLKSNAIIMSQTLRYYSWSVKCSPAAEWPQTAMLRNDHGHCKGL